MPCVWLSPRTKGSLDCILPSTLLGFSVGKDECRDYVAVARKLGANLCNCAQKVIKFE